MHMLVQNVTAHRSATTYGMQIDNLIATLCNQSHPILTRFAKSARKHVRTCLDVTLLGLVFLRLF